MNRRRGFAMVVVILVLALGAVVAAAVLDMVDLQHQVTRLMRLSHEARDLTEAGLMEVVGDEQLATYLPSITGENPTVNYYPSSYSPFKLGSNGGYQASISYIKNVPVRESSFGIVRGLIFEVSATGESDTNQANAAVTAEIYRLVGYPTGVVLPRNHAR